ncbi:HAD family hydrolase [Streptomyces bambusae]|uniref:HAD-IB family hydrolase n=1 Tax=Streptomyces bambusae TaxID=1550616 RepID=A0ABS6Z3L7_9ACTN|nr:HAD family hydrolase [Streptomyces bambusae]MBW5482348.1 HAD-IB family hydrolase [Streptomyces bambusae]
MNAYRTAFFDVDGTLTTAPSMFRFLRHYLSAMGHPPTEYITRRRELKAMNEVGCPREATNRAYFASLEGANAAEVTGLAEDWFREELRAGAFFHEHGVAALRRHQQDGTRIVFVSGSFPAVLDPIAEHLGADEVWCTEPEIAWGRYTGNLHRPPMLSAAKAETVRAVAAGHGAAPEHCIAYGDHISDLPMLKAAGHAVVVGGDKVLRTHARIHGWSLLPAAPVPPALDLPLWHTGRTGSLAAVTNEVKEVESV